MQDIYVVDAFADGPFRGNPAAVCPLLDWLALPVMQAIAAEMNLSETVFFVPDGDNFRVRWFTPTKEVFMIGHATLAAGHIVLSRLQPTLEAARFISGGDEMVVVRNGPGFELSMPALVPAPVPEPDGLRAALGCDVEAVLAAMHYLVLLSSPEQVANIRPDIDALARLDRPAVIVTAMGGVDADFVSRFFAPANGVPEDAVSGVAHCCLAPYWAKRLNRTELIGRQLSARGGTVSCRVEADRVILGGMARTFLEGTIHM